MEITRMDAIDLWEKDFMASHDFDYPEMEVIVEYAERQGYKVN